MEVARRLQPASKAACLGTGDFSACMMGWEERKPEVSVHSLTHR